MESSTLARTPTSKKKIRAAFFRYASLCEINESKIHYSEARPTKIGLIPTIGGITDCSGYFINANYYAWKNSGYFVPDPSGFNYSGYGNTNSILAHNHYHPAPKDKYMVGDFILYGTWTNTIHIMWCKKAGNTFNSLWSSHGEESGPEERRLRDDNRPSVGIFRLAVLL